MPRSSQAHGRARSRPILRGCAGCSGRSGARYELVGLALLLEAAVGLPATIAVFVGYDAISVLIVALAATWGAFVMAVACTIREVSRSEAESHALPGTS